MPLPWYRKTLSPEQITAIEDEARKKREAATKHPECLASTLGLPIAAGNFLLQLVARIEELEQKVAALQGPPHLGKIEKR